MEKIIPDETKKSEAQKVAEKTVFSVLLALSFSHLINDTIQSLIPAIYPLIKDSLHLTFSQIGLITLTYQLTASLLQPLVGLYTDKNPKPYSLAIGMGFTLLGLISLSQAHHFYLVLMSVALVGVGSSVFHPEASRLAYMASGGRHGMAQSLFQLGGNAGSSLGPLFAAMIIVPKGQSSISWFSLGAILAIVVMLNIGGWYKKNTYRIRGKSKSGSGVTHVQLPKSKVAFALGILLILVFSKYFYMASMTSYYTFYLIDKFHLSIQSAQVYLFIFLFSIAAGTFIGGPVGDRIGRKYVIWISILGVAPFSLLLPHANLLWTSVLSVFIGVILSSAFSAILVYAQELVPGNVGMIAGLFFGLAFGMGGVGSAVLGQLADHTSIGYVFQVCAYLPLIGLLTGLLPNVGKSRR
ncbi:MFS transporter, FSR family, fosmidomycin resistance protein [Chitinophaga sp. CF118]|uniref:MFS transporter n=1 Tax=Chitinophaga sp. CF118 TaxID=1884367 RepID=UPI0008EBE237|nr:MFS transporter [Chitinophaga sp. CF118]SFE27166.1 MFS transporter, FSR family, fosmidomycin resistance protein [Chitinophaga sp. CF118]